MFHINFFTNRSLCVFNQSSSSSFRLNSSYLNERKQGMSIDKALNVQSKDIIHDQLFVSHKCFSKTISTVVWAYKTDKDKK